MLVCSGLCSLCGVRFCLFSAVSRARFRALAVSCAESLRRLAAQLSSMATLEAAVSHDVQALLEAPPEPQVPIPATGPVSRLAHLRPRSRSRSPLPKAAPCRPRGSLLLNQLIARSPLAATLAPRPLPTALSSHGVRLAWLEAPRESRPAASAPTATVARKASQSVVPQAPLKHGNAGGTSIAAERDALPSAQRGVKFSLEPSRPVPCGLAVPTPRPMMTTTTRATPCCCCSPTPSSRPLYLQTSARWTSLWRPYTVVSLWTLSPLRSKTSLDLNPIFWLLILGATSGSEARLRLGLFLTSPLGLLKVPVSLNDPFSLAVKDDLVAPLSAFAGTCPSCSATRAVMTHVESISLFFDLTRVIPCLTSQN